VREITNKGQLITNRGKRDYVSGGITNWGKKDYKSVQNKIYHFEKKFCLFQKHWRISLIRIGSC